jgi:hypothetical protein
MRAAYRIAIFALIVSMLPNHILAQEGQIDLPSVGESSVVIVNQANIAINYSIRPENGDWSNYNISPGNNMKISCNNCTTSLFEIVIKTNDKEVRYDLESGDRFIIRWNSELALWDVYKVGQ